MKNKKFMACGNDNLEMNLRLNYSVSQFPL